ncbi:MAG: type II secretion system protein [Planctomycetes bacterium]|nr:type II secretion system protein [Planctomycetota bacterium]
MSRKAFTLIELLVVIAIIAMLLAILVPSLSAIKEYASIANCLSNQRSLAMCFIMYAGDNDSKFCSGYLETDAVTHDPPTWIKPPLQYDTSGAQVYVGDGDVGGLLLNLDARMNGFREGALWPYLESPKSLHCPGDRRARKGGADTVGALLRYRQMYNSYGMPDFYDCGGGDDREKLLSNIKSGGQKLLFVEYQYDRNYYNSDAWSYVPYDNKFWDQLGNYHNKGCTFAFVDGHAEEYRWKDARTQFYMSDRIAAENGANNPVQPGVPFGKGDYMPNNADFDWLDHHYPSKTRH